MQHMLQKLFLFTSHGISDDASAVMFNNVPVNEMQSQADSHQLIIQDAPSMLSFVIVEKLHLSVDRQKVIATMMEWIYFATSCNSSDSKVWLSDVKSKV